MNITAGSRGNILKFGETEIEFSKQFRLYILTQIANPPLLPEICIRVTVINFTVTLEALQDQLLSNVVMQERPELEEKRLELLESLVDDRLKLRELEDKVLDLLNTSIGNVLDDENLIQTLDNSETMVGIIEERVEETEKTQQKINENRTVYSVVADRGAILYFVVADFASVDVMYQFSLSWFTTLFSNCIKSTTAENSSTSRSSTPSSTPRQKRRVSLCSIRASV